MYKWLQTTGEGAITILAWVGRYAIFCGRALRDVLRPPYEGGELARQIYEVGWRSVPLIASSGFAIGVVLSMHTRASLERFGAEAMIPAGLAIALIRETGPLTAGLLMSGRVGAGIGAELGAMQVTEQIDALEASAVDSFKFLAVTRILACVLSLPLLTVVMDFAGMLGGFLAEHAITNMSFALYFTRAFSLVEFQDFIPATFKTAVFGFIIGSVASFLGFETRGGTEGVGQASHSQRGARVDLPHRQQRRARAPDLLSLPGGLFVSPGASAIRLEHVSKAFDTLPVLRDVSFEVKPGQAFCILGRSGTGKSVTLKHIMGLLQPDAGRIFVENEEITGLKGAALGRVRQRMGFLFQNAALFDSITVGENVAFPMRRHTRLSDDGDPRAVRRGSSQTSASSAISTRCPRNSPAACASARASHARWRWTLDSPRGRAERRPRSDHLVRDRRAAAHAQTPGHHARGRHAQHPQRADPRRRVAAAARRPHRRAGHGSGTRGQFE